jgi:hypothetical protein
MKSVELDGAAHGTEPALHGPNREDVRMATDSDPFSWITAQADGTEHAVTYTAQEASAALGRGSYEAVCGA